MALIDRIKYDSENDKLLVWKFPNEELKLGSQLIVNQSQEAIFVKSGKALDVFGPGRHTLSTGNIPLLNHIINLPFGGDSPFSAEIWFVNKTSKRDLRWGTKGPIQVIDPLFNYPVSIRAFGRWGIKIEDSKMFVNKLVGSMGYSDSEKIEEYFIGEILQNLSDSISQFVVNQNVSAFQLSAKLNILSSNIISSVTACFQLFGIELVNFNIERISIPDDEQKKFQEVLGNKMEIDQISSSKVGQAYTTMQTFETLKTVNENGNCAMGGLLASGVGLGIGLGSGIPIGQQLGSAMKIQTQSSVESASTDAFETLSKIKHLLDAGLISQQDYETKKLDILSKI